ncbi:MAG: hypothetical protein ACQEXJ_06565 [Myxococcota bacterium]
MAGATHGDKRGRALLLELFVVANLAFLAADIYLAHSINQFAHAAEWVPVAFSAVAPWLLLPGLLREGRRFEQGFGRVLGHLVGWASVAVGVVGMLLHMESSFFARQTLHYLVYTAPFAAPLSYTGLGLLLLMNRQVSAESPEWGWWVAFLALGGFIGNLALSLADHAQNGFFEATEWIPVISSAFAVGFLASVVTTRTGPRFLKLALWVVGLQVLVGIAGFLLHLFANLESQAAFAPSFIYGAPIFAPLLFPNLAILAALGLWHLKQQAEAAAE